MSFQEFMMNQMKEILEKAEEQSRSQSRDFALMKIDAKINTRPMGALVDLTTSIDSKVAPFMKNMTQAAAEAARHLERALEKDFEQLKKDDQGEPDDCKCFKHVFERAFEKSENSKPIVNKL